MKIEDQLTKQERLRLECFAQEIYKKAALIFHKEFANFTESKNLK